jgi:hypothetical protein
MPDKPRIPLTTYLTAGEIARLEALADRLHMTLDDTVELALARFLLADDAAITPDRCRHCRRIIGYGIEALHLGICDDCRDRLGS